MKLYYYQDHKGRKNFGDDLNPWLWKKLIPEILDDDEKSYFIGIGTLINSRLARNTEGATYRIIFGTGVGYGHIKLDTSYKVYCLRGPLSAQSLGLSESFALTDAAILVRRVFQSERSSKFKFTYMPHWSQAGKGWEFVCQDLGFGYIDPRWSVDKVLSSLGDTDVLLTEAMHGAIVADALRIPWVPIVSHDSILSFKWQDWCMSMGLEYCPTKIRRPRHPKSSSVLSPTQYVRDWFSQKTTARELKRVAMNSSPILSKNTLIESLTNQLEEKLQQFKADTAEMIYKFGTEN
jgi:succinoglycan biosynthesis protein ExoV